MVKSKRDLLKRQVAHAHNNVTTAMQHLYNVIVVFEPQHPELADSLKTAVVGLDTVKQVIDAFVVQTWGRLPDGWEKWRNVDD